MAVKVTDYAGTVNTHETAATFNVDSAGNLFVYKPRAQDKAVSETIAIYRNWMKVELA